ncbi:MAG: cytochrome c biogenesis protein CcsA [Helicobacter sp.]|nr:cytochrome c biogenesis protein CcsA [Helicobacter sp.]
MIRILIAQLGSFWLTYLLLFAYGAACAVATFIENDYGTESAKVVVYSSNWFAVLHAFLLINLLLILYRFSLAKRKRYSTLLLHASFVMILLGAAMTRYIGFEGMLHIREGESNSVMQSSEKFLLVRALKGDVNKEFSAVYYDFPLQVSYLYSKDFNYDLDIGGETINFSYGGFEHSSNPKDNQSRLLINLSYKGNSQTIAVRDGQFKRFLFGDIRFMVGWGTRDIELPFAIKLEDFELERYPGSHAPSSYSSHVVVVDDQKGITMPYHIYMNHTLDYGGYRFFQTSYDPDELGTHLSVNNDPGKIPTYIGYAMLIIAFIWILLDPKGRFKRLSSFVKRQNPAVACAFLLLCFAPVALHAESVPQKGPEAIVIEDELLQDMRAQASTLTKAIVFGVRTRTKEHANHFARLLVQDFGGRIKPMDTLASDFIHKITKRDRFLDMDNIQLLLGMLAYPEEWKGVKMIYIGTPALKQILGLNPSEKYASFYDMYQDGYYKLFNLVAEVNLKKPAERGTLDKDILAVNERFEAMFAILSAEILRILPVSPDKMNANVAGDPTLLSKWYSPVELGLFSEEERNKILHIVRDYFRALDDLVAGGSASAADSALQPLFDYQNEHGAALLPSSAKISAEILLNRSNPFQMLCYLYLLFGLLMFAMCFVRILRNTKGSRTIDRILLGCIVLVLVCNTAALLLRWYVGGHAPWSNAYESMIYIAWATAICGVLLLRGFLLAFSTASVMAGIVLFVAHLGFMDPQIGNLVPVLKSYWLNIHVSIITASYGFLALSFLLGAVILLLFLLRSPKRAQLDDSIQTLSAVNELSLIVGLGMLTVGTFLGGIWANESWGRYWGWDSKETWSLISIVTYTLILHARFVRGGDSPYILASLSVVGFYSILMTYFGVNFYLSGLHSYAAGDPVPIPAFLYYLVGGTIALIVCAGFKSDLKSGIS